MENQTHMIGIYATFIFMIILFVMPFVVIKYVRKREKGGRAKKD